MKKQLHKLLTALLIGMMLTNSIAGPAVVLAEDGSGDTANQTTQTQESTPAPAQNTTSESNATQTQNTSSNTPSMTENGTTSVTITPTPTPTDPPEEGDVHRKYSSTSAIVQGVNPTPTPTQTQTNGGSGQVGGSTVTTGDATNGATISTIGNNNGAQTGTDCCAGTGATIANTGNGSGSANNGSATLANTNGTNQNNTAVINNDLHGATLTGQNNTSDNVGDSSIKSGDANTSGTLITAVNTNASGIMVSEFNIADDHRGDIILDFAAGCILGCGTPASAINSGNGSNSDNSSYVDLTNNNDTFQNNDATVGNDLVLSADSGYNTASRNTGGDSNITSGDANIAANALTFANNNFAGNVIYGTVNIYGDLIGDIILTEAELAKYGISSTGINAVNSGNGSNSANNAGLDLANTDSTFQTNDANILNNITYDAQTGVNDTSNNTGGDSSITSGDTNILANVLNIANTNVAGGNMWLVLVNRAGQWVGQLLGAPDGSMFAGSAGLEFIVGDNGEITASNNGNGSGSTNDAAVSETNTNNTTQNNNADIVNNLDLTANTGHNQSSDNTGGNSQIKTGDANIIANIVNFVNNNVSGNGKLFVTVVNVFGSWLGDFVAPGQQQRSHDTANNSNNTSSNNSASNGTTSTTTTNKEVASTAVDGNKPLSGKIVRNSSTSKGSVLTTSDNGEASLEGPGGSLVKGTHFEKQVAQELSKKMTLNLAWLVVLLPIAGLIFIMKKVSTKLLLKKH
jgi:fibronectin-binding autotransporter adhesin